MPWLKTDCFITYDWVNQPILETAFFLISWSHFDLDFCSLLFCWLYIFFSFVQSSFLSLAFSNKSLFFMSLHIFFIMFWFSSLSIMTLFTVLLLKMYSYSTTFLYYSSLSPLDSLTQPCIYHYYVCWKESIYNPPY